MRLDEPAVLLSSLFSSWLQSRVHVNNNEINQRISDKRLNAIERFGSFCILRSDYGSI
jgi:hypothetical protein